MIPENVTLIVKAPNQQIEDQNVECQSSWTVRQLKGHLANVYPSKPRTEEQKIIYSGQLLDDALVLKDILRTYDSQMVHTMHLVCTANRAQPVPEMARAAQPESRSTEGLRQRTSTTSDRPETIRPETRQNDQNHTMEMQNYLSSFAHNYGRPQYDAGSYLAAAADPATVAGHVMAMQQAYLQYMRRWQETVAPPGTQQPQQAQPVAPPAEEEEERRDWLDHLYAASRLAILFSLVYLYGSPARLLLVVLLAAAGYLHQIGFFRDLQVNPQEPRREGANAQNANVNAPNANGNNANGNNVNVNIVNGANFNNANVNGANVNNANINGANVNNANINGANVNNANSNITVNAEAQLNEHQQSLLAVTWMIFSSFFASLIPDTNQ